MATAMKYLLPAVDENASRLRERILQEFAQTWTERIADDSRYYASYRRVVSLQAWRVRFVEQIYPQLIGSIFLEAQNDALLSVVLAHIGMWRSSLQSLRSCIECVLNACYYADHPVEAELWRQGVHRLEFSEHLAYLERHPVGIRRLTLPNVLANLRQEYNVLSRAVHASAQSFHMTRAGAVTLTKSDEVDHAMWSTRHASCLLWVNFLLISLYSPHLLGAQNRDLRKCISLAIPAYYHNSIFDELKVRLFNVD